MIAFLAIEGIFSSRLFCAIFWLGEELPYDGDVTMRAYAVTLHDVKLSWLEPKITKAHYPLFFTMPVPFYVTTFAPSKSNKSTLCYRSLNVGLVFFM